MTPFKILRIIILLIILAIAAFYTKTQRLSSTNWAQPLDVVIFPINAEQNAEVGEYIKSLNTTDFAEIDRFFERESAFFDVISSMPTKTVLAQTLDAIPPAPPEQAGILSIMIWSLKLRYWAYKNTPDNVSNKTRVRMFVLYYSAKSGRQLKHSLGLHKGLLGVVHAFASQQQAAQNKIIIAHELLHTVGASDKYGRKGEPVFPDGYAEPDLQPRYPQQYAEIMAARIATSAKQFHMAESLQQCMVGEKTAREIKWLRASD